MASVPRAYSTAGFGLANAYSPMLFGKDNQGRRASEVQRVRSPFSRPFQRQQTNEVHERKRYSAMRVVNSIDNSDTAENNTLLRHQYRSREVEWIRNERNWFAFGCSHR